MDDADLTGRLRELADLHASGAITDAEFTAAKARVLGPPPPGAPSPGPMPPGPMPPGSIPPGPTARPASSNIRRNVLLTIVAVAVVVVVAVVIAVRTALPSSSDIRSAAIGTWSCVDPTGYTEDYVIGDGTYQIPQDNRSGTWSLDGMRLTVSETELDSDGDPVRGYATVDLSSLTEPVTGAVSFGVTYGSGSQDSATGGADYRDGVVTIRLRHDSALNQGSDDVTCTKQ